MPVMVDDQPYYPPRPPAAPATPTAPPIATPPPAAAAPPAAPAQSPTYAASWTLGMDPEVVAALAYEKQALADIAGLRPPRGPSMAGLNASLAAAAQDAAIQRARLAEMEPIQREALEHDIAIARRNTINQLAARGIIRSGETGYQAGELDRSYRLSSEEIARNRRYGEEDITSRLSQMQASAAASRAEAAAAHSDAMYNYQRDVLAAKRDAHNNVIDAYTNAFQRVIENPALYLGIDPASLNPATLLQQIPK